MDYFSAGSFDTATGLRLASEQPGGTGVSPPDAMSKN